MSKLSVCERTNDKVNDYRRGIDILAAFAQGVVFIFLRSFGIAFNEIMQFILFQYTSYTCNFHTVPYNDGLIYIPKHALRTMRTSNHIPMLGSLLSKSCLLKCFYYKQSHILLSFHMYFKHR